MDRHSCRIIVPLVELRGFLCFYIHELDFMMQISHENCADYINGLRTIVTTGCMILNVYLCKANVQYS